MLLHRKRDREVIKLRFIEGLSVRATANRTGLYPGVVQRRERAFRNSLKILNLDAKPINQLRDIVAEMLDRAEALYSKPVAAASPYGDLPDPRQYLSAI